MRKEGAAALVLLTSKKHLCFAAMTLDLTAPCEMIPSVSALVMVFCEASASLTRRVILDEGCALQVFSVIPRNCATPLEVHGGAFMPQCLLLIEEPVVVGCVSGGVFDLLMDGEDNFHCGSCVEIAVSTACQSEAKPPVTHCA